MKESSKILDPLNLNEGLKLIISLFKQQIYV